MTYNPDINVLILKGQTITDTVETNGEMVVTLADGRTFRFYHDQDCCESVLIESTKGDWSTIYDTPLIDVTEQIEHEWPVDLKKPEYTDSDTWTTFTFTTSRGTVVVRWHGSSNGYYSESVSFHEIK